MLQRQKRPMARLLAAMLTCLLTTPILSAPAGASAPAAVSAAQSTPALLVDQRSVTPVGPGITRTEITRFDALGWIRAQVLEADLTNPAVSLNLLFSGSLTGTETLSRAVARTGAVAGINGDFFDIQATRAPVGGAVQAGQLLKSGSAGWETVAGLGADGLGRMAGLYLSGSVLLSRGAYPLAALNHYVVPAGGIGLYTPAWGSASRQGVAAGAQTVREVTVVGGVVTAVSEQIGSGPIPEGGFLLIGREAGAEAMASLQPGDFVPLSYGPSDPFRFAVGGSPILVRDGQVEPVEAVGAHPRTAVGFSADGRRIYLVVVEGRQAHSRGMTLLELARFMQELGAHNALNLDGGGSSAMAARQPGAATAALASSPAGGERAVANGIGLFVAPGSGQVQGVRVEGQSRVFPGLTRQLSAFAYDESYAPASAATVTWSATDGAIDAKGLLRAPAKSGGSITVTASAGGRAGSHSLQVLGELVRLETVPARLELPAGSSATFTVVGYDAEGRSAPIDPADLQVSGTGDVALVPAGIGFRVTAREAGPAVVTVTAGDVQTHLPVAAGLMATLASAFETPAGWSGSSSNAATAAAALTFAPGVTGEAASLQYDFTLGGGTRAAYLTAAPGDLPLPGRPTVIGISVYGDGNGAWLRAQLRDARGTLHTINLAEKVEWTGWRYIEQVIPAGVVYPVSLWRIYPVETNAARQYAGTILFDNLVVKEAPAVTLPERAVVADLVEQPVATWGTGFSPLALSAERIRKGEARAYDEGGTRVITLDAGTGSFRSAGFAQLVELKRLLAEAELDPAVRQVVVTAALPTSALTDRLEAALVEDWLAQLRERTGKGVAYVALGGSEASIRRVEGVIHVTASGDRRVELGVGSGQDWLRAAFQPVQRPQRASTVLNAPATLKVGERVTVAPGGIALSDWSGEGIIFGAPHQTRAMEPFFTAAFNPATGELRALRTGTVTLRLRQGDQESEVTISVVP